MSDERPLVSAVIMSRDRETLLFRCIDSISRSDYPNWEIVIVDNGAAESNRAIEEHLAQHPHRDRIHHIVTPPISFASMRKMSTDRASGKYLISIDDDCIAEPNTIANMVDHFEREPEVGVIGGNIKNIGFDGEEQFKGRGRYGTNARYEPCVDPYQAELFGGGNASIRRSAFDEAGGYDPYLTDGLEDSEIVQAIRAVGYRVVYDPEVRIEHHHTPSRIRNLWRNLHHMRLYVFFKHFWPRGVGGWLRFLVDETKLFGFDVISQLGAMRFRAPKGTGPVGYPKWLAKMLTLRAIELLKVVSARLRIPLIAWHAAATRRRSNPPAAHARAHGVKTRSA